MGNLIEPVLKRTESKRTVASKEHWLSLGV